jgi:hypothetical protein
MNDQSIHVGGSVTSGAAVGHTASGHYHNTAAGDPGDQVRQLLEGLSSQIRDHQHELDDLQELNESVQSIREELAKAEPRRSFVSTALKGIAASAGGVTAVADAALKVAQLFK